MTARMRHLLRNALLALRDLLISVGPFALVAAVLLIGAYRWLDPNPPRRVTLATGPAQSAYAEFGKRYAHALAADGIEVVLLPSGGSSDHPRLLREGRADQGFARGGSADPVHMSRGQSDYDTPQALLAELDQLERQVEKISVPLSYADELYALREHINLACSRLASGRG